METTLAPATADVFFTAFLALSKTEQHAFITKLLMQDEFIEDLLDVVTIEQRRHEPTRSLEEYLANRIQK